MTKKPIVHLRVYKGIGGNSNILKDGNGKIQNENHLVKEIYNTLEWSNYLKNIRVHGFVKVDVEKVIENGEEISTEAIQKEVDSAMNPVADVPQTPDQKRIAELEAKIDALANGGNKAPEPIKEKTLEDYTMNELKEMYPNVADLGIRSKTVFIEKVREFEA